MAQEEQNQEQQATVAEPGSEGQDPGAADSTETSSASAAAAGAGDRGVLFEPAERDALWQRWMEIQSTFVDQPQRSVEQANALVADLTERLVDTFRSQQARLEAQWGEGSQVSTEELRMLLQRYRSFFSRLLELHEHGSG